MWSTAIARYFFNIHDGVDIIDDTGTELPDIEAVQTQAVISAGEAIRDLGAKFWQARDWQLVVLDELGAVVLTLNFSGQSALLERAAFAAKTATGQISN